MTEDDRTSLPSWLEPLRAAVDGAWDAVGPQGRSPFVPPGARGRPSAVLILFGETPQGPDVLLIQRGRTMSSHAGQPAFPGGASDPEDADATATALREAEEEVGLDRTEVHVFAQLPDLWVPPSGFIVSPVMAWWHTPGTVTTVSRAEVTQVERVQIADLVDPANRYRVRHPRGFVGPAFDVADLLVWGFTAMVLDWVLEAGGWSRPWNDSDVRDLPKDMWDLAVAGVPETEPGLDVEVPPTPFLPRPEGAGGDPRRDSGDSPP